MLEKLKLTEEKYNDIAEKLMNPDIINDTKAYASYMKEQLRLMLRRMLTALCLLLIISI